MASKTFFLLALCFAVVLLITSEVAAAEDLASHHYSNLVGRGGYNSGEHGGQGVYNSGGHKGHGKDGGAYNSGHRHCNHGCSSFEEASAYKQTQN